MQPTNTNRLLLQPLALLFSFFITGMAFAQPTADFSMSKTGGCSPLAIAFTNTSTASATATYAWDFGNSNTSVLKNPSAIYLEERVYTITLIVTDGTQTSTKTRTVTVYKKPVVAFTSTKANVCLPEAVQFNSTSTAGDGSISNQQWDFGDGITQQGFGSSIAHQYPYPLTPAVSLTVTNSFGCVATATKTDFVNVLAEMKPLFTINKTLLCSLTDSIKLTNNSTGPGTLSYLWNFGDGTTSTLANPWHKYTQRGVYQVRLTLTNEVGCSVTSAPVSVNAARFDTDFNPSSLCRQASFAGSSYLYPSNSFWQFGNGLTGNGWSTISHTYATAGTYNVTLINTYSNVCKDTITKAVTVQNTGTFNSDFTGPTTACKGSYLSFTSSSSVTPSARTWNWGDGFSGPAFGNTVNHQYNTPGTYTITLTNTFGTCSETVTKTIVVNDLPATTGFLVDFGGQCGAPVTVTFRDTTAGAVAWAWRRDWSGNPPFATTQQSSQSYTSDGAYSVNLTVTNAAGCTTTVWKSIVVSRPTVSIGYTQTSSPKGWYDCDSLRLKLIANTNSPITSYNWNFGNGQTSTLANPEVFYNQIGTYAIILTYTTENGCTGNVVFTARVYGKPQANFSYAVPCGPMRSLSLEFTDTSPYSDDWNWSFGDATQAYWVNPIHTYNDTGMYTVRFINKIGRCSDTVYKPVHAHLLPSNISITKAENTCDGTRGTVTFDQRSVRCSGGTWNWGDGTTSPYDSSDHNVKHTYTATGQYNVTLTTSYRNCNHMATVTVWVLLKQSPVLSGSPAQLCANGTLNVQLSGMQNNPRVVISTWNWPHYSLTKFEHNNGIPFTGNGAFAQFVNAGYNSTLSGFTAGTTAIRAITTSVQFGCADTSNYLPLQVNGPISGFIVSNNNACYKSPVTLTDTSRSPTAAAITAWRWEMGDGTIISRTTNATVVYRYQAPGSYAVRLTVTDATGCASTSVRTVNARGPKAAFSTSGLFVPNVPLNTTVTFFNNTTSFNSSPIYTWHYGNGVTSTGYSGSHTYTVPGTYEVMLIAADPAIPCADTARTTIYVKDFNAAFTYTKTYLGAGSCPPVLVRINNLSVGFTRLEWDFGDGSTSTQFYPSHIYHNPGMYRIVLRTYGYNGLSGTYRDSVEVRVPSVTLSADVLAGCLSQQVAFTSTGQNTSSHVWDFGDGTAGSATGNATHNYLSAGIYNPRVIVKDNLGCEASVRLADTVVIDSLTIAIKGIPALVCDSALINFNPDVLSFAAAKLGTPLQYKWDFGTGNPADTSNLRNPAFRYNTPGTYTVRFKVVSPYGCVRETTQTFTVQQKASGAITGIPETCEQTSLTFTGAATPSTNVTWDWNFGNGNTSAQATPPAQVYTTPGTYTIRLILNRNGCLDTTDHQLTVHGKPVINAAPRETILCRGDSLQLSANGGGTYAWTPAAGLSNATIGNPIAKPVVTTQYKVQVTSNKGCVNRDSINITVAQPITVSLTGPAGLCLGDAATVTASGATSYAWINNTTGLSSTTVAAPTVRPTLAATYTVVGSDNYSCFTDTAEIAITVYNLPTVNAGPDVQIQGSSPHQLGAIASNDVVSWLWSPGDWLSCMDCPSPIATPKMETDYVVKVTNNNGCTATDTVVVKMNCAEGNIYIPSAFTPNNDGKNDLFYISGSGLKNIRHLRIYDRWGGLVFERTNFGLDDMKAAWDGRLNGQAVATGTYVYLAEMECSSGERFGKKGTVTLVR